MPLALRPLFGLSCIDEAMPGGTDQECAAALAEAEPLRSAMERAPVVELVQDQTYDNKPDLKPEPAPAPGPGLRR